MNCIIKLNTKMNYVLIRRENIDIGDKKKQNQEQSNGFFGIDLTQSW